MASIRMTKSSSTLRPALLIVAIAVCLYASTLMTTINGCIHEYCVDVGEFQIALPLWGTVHHTGYPLYMMLGSPFVTLLRVFGISPAMGASLYSLFWGILAIAGLVVVIQRWSNNLWLVGSIGLLFAVVEPIWVHNVLAEVYSLSMAFSVAILYLTFKLREKWSDKLGWLLAFAGGAGIAHHRLLALLLIPIGVYLLPVALRSKSFPRWLIIASLCFGAGFLPYLDIPLRVQLGSTWNYDRTNTWQGFWRIFLGKEVVQLQRPNLAPSALLSAAHDIGQVLISELTLPGVILISWAAAHGIWSSQTRSATWFVASVGAIYVLFVLFFRNAVLIQATLMNAILASCVLLAIGLSSLKTTWQNIAGVICLGWALGLAIHNWPFVTSLTHNPSGVNYVATVENLEAPEGSIVMAPWGEDYFVLAYAQRIEGRMAQWQIVDHRADYGDLTANGLRRIYTHSSTLYIFGPGWWAERLGSPLRITSAGPDMLMLTSEPLGSPTHSGIPLGDSIVLDHWEIRPLNQGSLNVTLYWVATQTPTADYSTFVHLSDQETIAKPEDLVAQSDYQTSVYGWYPTSHWVTNEIIREDHLLQFQPERSPKMINVGMYRQDSNGVFQHLGHVQLRQQAGTWVAVSQASP